MNDFAALASLLCALLALHSIALYPLTLLLVAKRDRTFTAVPPLPPGRPTLAICMCAYNEEKPIEAKMERLLEIAAAYGPATIHIYADAPTDRTAALLEKYADRADIVFGQERRGKTFGMNLLVERSDSELLLFTDANVESEADVAQQLVQPLLADPEIGCTTARLVYSNRKETPTAKLGAAYWAVEEAIKRLESRSVGLIGCDGAMFIMRRSLHVTPPAHLIDDLYLSLSILISGSRIVSVDHVEVYERSATQASEEGRRKRRIACQAWNVHRALWPRLRRLPTLSLYAYFSHRPMKWLMPFFVAASVCFFTLAIGLSRGAFAGLATAAGIALAYLIGSLLPLPPFSLFYSAVCSLAGVAIGTYESFILDRTYTIWNPALSVRDQTPLAEDG